MGEMVNTGAVSVRPYPEKQAQPRFSSTSRIKVGDDAAPPRVTRFKLLKSYIERSGQFTRAVAMAGTRLQWWTRSASMSRACPPLQPGPGHGHRPGELSGAFDV